MMANQQPENMTPVRVDLYVIGKEKPITYLHYVADHTGDKDLQRLERANDELTEEWEEGGIRFLHYDLLSNPVMGAIPKDRINYWTVSVYFKETAEDSE